MGETRCSDVVKKEMSINYNIHRLSNQKDARACAAPVG